MFAWSRQVFVMVLNDFFHQKRSVRNIFCIPFSGKTEYSSSTLYPSYLVKLLYQLLKLDPGTQACDTFLEYKTIPFADNPIIIILRTVKARIANIIKEQPLGEQ